MAVYVNKVEYAEHVALVKGDLSSPGPVLVRMHAINAMDDLLGAKSGRNDLLRQSMREIAREGRGVIVLIRDTKDTSITDALTRDPEERMTNMLKEYGVGAQILVDLGVKDMTILTRSPAKKLIGLDGYGLNVIGQRTIPTEGAA